MKHSKIKRSTLSLLAFAFIATGTYNSLVVNSDAFMDGQNVRFVKRLDELNGLTTAGRKLANNGEWIKLKSRPVALPTPVQQDAVVVTSSSKGSPVATPEVAPEPTAQAAIKEELSLDLTEVFNAKKYAQGLKPSEFSGTLNTNDGVIESMSVNLPNGESVSISFAEMAGNVFEYDIDGQPLSGMMYQMDKSAYMVTLTNGPFEGTRLKFSTNAPVEEEYGNNSAAVAENNAPEQAEQEASPYGAIANDDGTQMPVGEFGAEASPLQSPDNADVAQNEVPAPEGGYGFNFDNSSATF